MTSRLYKDEAEVRRVWTFQEGLTVRPPAHAGDLSPQVRRGVPGRRTTISILRDERNEPAGYLS